MPFHGSNQYINNNYKKIQKNNSLQTLRSISSPNDRKHYNHERVSSFTFVKASLTVETALVLPIFMFAICFMMYFTEVVRIQAEIVNELYKQGKHLALYSYVYNQTECNSIIDSGKIENLVTGSLSNLYVKDQVKKELGEDYFANNNIDNGMSLILSSYIKENDMIDIIAIYKIRIPCNFFHLKNIAVIQRARIRGWIGFEGTNDSNTKEEIVYITEKGSVYHKDKSCTHINLSISYVSMDKIKNIRNKEGGKYYKCEICGDESSYRAVYITNTGNRYHSKKDCGGITRDVIAVPISQVGKRKACSRCGN